MVEATQSTDWPAVRAAIADAMAARGMSSQRALAEQAGVDQATLSRFLAGKQALAFDTVRRIASALALDPAALLGLAPPAAPHPEEAHSAVSKGEGPLRMIPHDDIRPFTMNPRREPESSDIGGLASSILDHGLLEPLIVTPVGDIFSLVAGERRWRAIRQLVHDGDLPADHAVPCVVRDVHATHEHILLSLVENLQREDLDPLDEAETFAILRRSYGMTTARIAESVGRTQRWVEQRLALLRLGGAARAAIVDGVIGPAAARHVARLEDESLQQAVVDQIRAGALAASEDAVRTRVGMLLSKPAAERPRIIEDRPGHGMRRGPDPDEDEDDNPPVTDEPQDPFGLPPVESPVQPTPAAAPPPNEAQRGYLAAPAAPVPRIDRERALIDAACTGRLGPRLTMALGGPHGGAPWCVEVRFRSAAEADAFRDAFEALFPPREETGDG